LPEPEFEASDVDWIFTEVLGLKRAELSKVKTIKVSDFARAEAFAKERATHKPLQYVLGNTEFYGKKLEVKEGVLIPRPETELLTEEVIKLAEGKTVLDLCTGSGAIAIAVKLETSCTVTASDVSDVAIEVAKRNAELNGVEIEIIKSDLFNDITGKFDIIVSNPPYIPTADVAGLMSEVKDYEPLLALDGGADGLDIIRRIAEDAKTRLNDGGILLLEIGIGQADAVTALLSGYADVTVMNDYDNIPRIVKASYRG
jgi:HemK-related putative methylase/protein-(glutamine-N5) methyltransferase, release factor-specific